MMMMTHGVETRLAEKYLCDKADVCKSTWYLYIWYFIKAFNTLTLNSKIQVPLFWLHVSVFKVPSSGHLKILNVCQQEHKVKLIKIKIITQIKSIVKITMLDRFKSSRI
jgi:hypothetical protein